MSSTLSVALLPSAPATAAAPGACSRLPARRSSSRQRLACSEGGSACERTRCGRGGAPSQYVQACAGSGLRTSRHACTCAARVLQVAALPRGTRAASHPPHTRFEHRCQMGRRTVVKLTSGQIQHPQPAGASEAAWRKCLHASSKGRSCRPAARVGGCLAGGPSAAGHCGWRAPTCPTCISTATPSVPTVAGSGPTCASAATPAAPNPGLPASVSHSSCVPGSAAAIW